MRYKEYKEVVKPNGVVNRFPVLTQEEWEKKEQEILIFLEQIIEEQKKKIKER